MSIKAQSQIQSPIKAALKECRPTFLVALLFSAVINMLMLAVPVYSLQVLDRVLSSGSTETLIMLTLIVAICLLFMGLLQGLRSLLFSQIGRWLDDKLSKGVVEKTANFALYKPNIGTQPLRDLGTIRGFINSPALASVFDVPWAPIYFIVIYLINLKLGVVVTLGAIVLLIVAIVTEKLPSKKVEAANEKSVEALQAFESILRNAEVIKSMGLLENASRRWKTANQQSLESSYTASSYTTVELLPGSWTGC